MKAGRLGALAAIVALVACAPRVAPRLPEGEDYLFPTPRLGEVSGQEAEQLRSAWREIQAGDTRAAERRLAKLVARHPGLLPATTALGYARLRAGRAEDALRDFEAVLAQRPEQLAALVGAASAWYRLGEPERALDHHRRAQAAHPDDALSRKRLGELKLQVTERRVAAARAALEAGDGARALEEYRRALDAAPEVAGVRLECGELLLGQGDPSGAAELLEADPQGERQVLLRLAELRLQLGEPARALEALRRVLRRDPKDEEAQRRALEARRALELQGMPEEYRRIPQAPRITRADLAALVVGKVTALSRLPGSEPEVAIDISGSWAREYVLRSLALGIFDVYSNHTFQPGAIARRGDLARVVSRVLELLGWPDTAGPAITDMSRTHLHYEAASRAVAAGLMDLTPAGGFEPWRPVSGRDATDVVDALARLVGP